MTETLALNPDELREFIVNQAINHGLKVQAMEKENREQALAFGKWTCENGWSWFSGVSLWKRYVHGRIERATDDELWSLYEGSKK